MRDWMLVVLDVVVLSYIYYKVAKRDRVESALNAANGD